MNIAVSGGTSAVGRNMVEAFLAEGLSILALGRDRDVGSAIKTLGAEFRQGNIEDGDYVRSALRRRDVVISCATHTSPWRSWDEFERANVQGPRYVVGACLHIRVERVIHLSTPPIYFSGSSAELIDEGHSLPEPLTQYARSKKMAGDLVTEATVKNQLPAILLRLRAIHKQYDRTILPRVLEVMRRGIFHYQTGDTAKIDITATQNVVHAIRLCFTADNSRFGRAYNISNEDRMMVRKLIELVSKELEVKARLFLVPYPLLSSYAYELELLARVTGKEPSSTRYSISLLGVTQTLSLEGAHRELKYTSQVTTIEGSKAFSKRCRW